MIAAQLQQYIAAYQIELQVPSTRYASFDYCYNYFQKFNVQNSIPKIADPNNLETSVLQLGFYLASWGMYRGSTAILQHNSQVLIPVIQTIADTPAVSWNIDVSTSSTDSIDNLINLYDRIGQSIQFPIPITRKGKQYIQQPSAILVTKIMLGVFGNTPAMDEFFCKGSKTVLGPGDYRANRSQVITMWNKLARIYRSNAALLNEIKIYTRSFSPGGLSVKYPIAKLLDMAFFQRGAEIIDAKKNASEN